MSSLSPRSQHLIKNFLIGGAALGGTVGLTTALANYLRNLKEEGDPEGDDPNTQYINLRKKASVGGGLAVAGGVISAVAIKALVDQLYKKYQKSELKNRLNSAQTTYADALDDEAQQNKQANHGQPMSIMEGVTSLPVATALLLGLASAVVANRTLDKAFPVVKPPNERDTRRVVIRRDPEEVEEEKEEKEASAIEFLVRNAVLTGCESLTSVVKAAANGLAPALNVCVVHGWEAVEELAKTASAHPLEEPWHSMAVAHVARSGIAPCVALVAASHCFEVHPAYCKIARALPEETRELLYAIATEAGNNARHNACAPYATAFPDGEVQEKSASKESLQALEAGLLKLLTERRGQADGEEPADQIAATHGAPSTDSDEHAQPVEVLAKGRQAARFGAKNKDAIDAALNAQAA